MAQVRVAYAVGRSVGSSVTRNRTRRRLRVVVSQVCGAGELGPGSYVVSARREAAQLPFVELRTATEKALLAVGACGSGRGGTEAI